MIDTLNPDQWRALFAGARHSAVHLEMRDAYAVEDETDDIARFNATGRLDLAAEAEAPERLWWLDLMRQTKKRGVRLRRARIISEPVSDYIRYEYAGAPLNIMAGEEVRWLPRTKATRIALPGADFWLFDHQIILFNHFTGNGGWLGNELVTSEPDLAALCAKAFEDVWALATPHDEYQPA
jgi:hypothetical protein